MKKRIIFLSFSIGLAMLFTFVTSHLFIEEHKLCSGFILGNPEMPYCEYGESRGWPFKYHYSGYVEAQNPLLLNFAFYFVIFSGIYFVYLKLTQKPKKK